MNESVDDESTESKAYTEMNVSALADNGVKSAVFMARQLDSQQTNKKHRRNDCHKTHGRREVAMERRKFA